MESSIGTRHRLAHQYHDDGSADYGTGKFRLGSGGSCFRQGEGMKLIRAIAIGFLVLTGAACVFADLLAPASYAHQFRELPNAPPSRQHLLGTDDLGRDRFSRVLQGTRVSLLLAPAAALLSSMLAMFIGASAGFLGGWTERCLMRSEERRVGKKCRDRWWTGNVKN